MEILKLTPVLSNGVVANGELVKGEFNTVVKGLADEILKTNEFNFIVITKMS